MVMGCVQFAAKGRTDGHVCSCDVGVIRYDCVESTEIDRPRGLSYDDKYFQNVNKVLHNGTPKRGSLEKLSIL